MDIFNYYSEKVRSYAVPSEDIDHDVDFESPREEIKKIENMFVKDSIYNLTPKYHLEVTTITKTFVPSTIEISIMFTYHLNEYLTKINGGGE